MSSNAVIECGRALAPDLEQVRAHAAASIARYKLPSRLLVVAEMPRTATGKIDRCAVRALVDEQVAAIPGPGVPTPR